MKEGQSPFKSSFVAPFVDKFGFHEVVGELEKNIEIYVNMPRDPLQDKYTEFGRDNLGFAREIYLPAAVKMRSKEVMNYWRTPRGKRVWNLGMWAVRHMETLDKPENEAIINDNWEAEIPEEERKKMTAVQAKMKLENAKKQEVYKKWRNINNLKITDDRSRELWESASVLIDYMRGLNAIVYASVRVGVWKMIEGRDLEDLEREAKVYEVWVPGLMAFGLSKEEATGLIATSIITTKNIQRRVGVKEHAEGIGMGKEYLEYQKKQGEADNRIIIFPPPKSNGGSKSKKKA